MVSGNKLVTLQKSVYELKKNKTDVGLELARVIIKHKNMTANN